MLYKILSLSLILLLLLVLPVVAQDDVVLPDVGDVPLASKILVTRDDDDPTTAVIRGETGAVFPNAFVVVQNLYTQDRETRNATVNGEFTISLYGQDQTPYWISAFQRFPSDADIESAVGIIIYGDGDDNTFYVESDFGETIPSYRLSGEFGSTQIKSGDAWTLDITVQMDVADNLLTDGLRYSGEIYLTPILDDTRPRILMADTTASNISATETSIKFDFNFDAIIPELSTQEQYQVQFMGFVQSGDGEREPWYNSILLGTHIVDTSLDVIALPVWLSNQSTPFEDLMWAILPDAQLQTNNNSLKIPIYTHQLATIPPDAYSLEPLWINSLALPIDDGQLSVTVTRPDGTVDQIDADITQMERQLNSDYVTLATPSTILETYPFTDYGDYDIQVSGRLRLGENVYYARQTSYQIRIAEPLNLSVSMLAGTPLEVGDTMSIGVHMMPQLPADVMMDVTFSTLDGAVNHQMQQGQADNYGYFAGESIDITQAGTYQISYQASYIDAEGRYWSGDVLSMGVIANPDGTVLAHGQRGIAGYDGVGQAWFDTRIYPNDDVTATQQPYYPYYSGDVAYIPDAPDSGIYPRLTSLMDSRDAKYMTVTRPDVILRQFIAGDTETSVDFNGEDTFNQQLGAGVDGIRTGDYFFLFGGVANDYDSAIYGATAIVLDEDEPARVLSPFIDSLMVFGQDVDLFFVPTGARPAQVMTIGETLSIVGQVAPTLPAQVTVSLTSPSGHHTQFTDDANAIGYFYSPENNIELNEIGVWQVDIGLTYYGETSLGVVERPYPTGHLSYVVYVVPPDNPPLGESEFVTETSRITKTYAPAIPEGWTDVHAFATITTPSAILLQEELTVFPAGTSFTYNPTTLAREFPNVELLDTTDGNHVADVLTLTLTMTGIDASGNLAIRTRSYSITHDVTYAVDEGILR